MDALTKVLIVLGIFFFIVIGLLVWNKIDDVKEKREKQKNKNK